MAETRREKRKDKRKRESIADNANQYLRLLLEKVRRGIYSEFEANNLWVNYCIKYRLDEKVHTYFEDLCEEIREMQEGQETKPVE